MAKKRYDRLRLFYPREYQAWCGMKCRCFNKNCKCYPRYGGRGISVCESWVRSFKQFLSDIGPCPSLSHSLDRINNNGSYEPGNVRWATTAEQSRNRRSNVHVRVDGEDMLLTDAARRLGTGTGAIKRRIDESGNLDLVSLASAAVGPRKNLYRGVYGRGSGRFSAVFWNGQRLVQIGTYDSPEEAHVNWLVSKVSSCG